MRKHLIKATLIAVMMAMVTVAYLPVVVSASQKTISIEVSRSQAIPGDISVINGKYYMATSTGDYAVVGDRASPAGTFLPKLELLRWGEECGIKLDLGLTGGTATYNAATKVLTWNSRAADRRAINFYYKPETDSVEFDIILKAKPATNVQSLGFTSDNLVFYYQPPLTQEYTAGWSNEFECDIAVTETDVTRISDGKVIVSRPVNVVGSYAVYHATKIPMYSSQVEADKYRTGKAFHWYRPLIWDSSTPRKETWGILNVNPQTGQRTVTIDQAFLNSAVYPVTIDDTFGFTTAGGSSWSIAQRAGSIYVTTLSGSLFTCPSAGTTTQINAWLKTSSAGSHACRAGIYLHSDLSLKVGSDSESKNLTTSYQDFSFTLASTVLANTDYVLATAAYETTNYENIYVAYDDGAANQGHWIAYTWGPLPDPFPTPNHTTSKFSIYCTYTPSASYDITNAGTSPLAFGTIIPSTVYWAIGHTPDNPIDDAHCTYTLTVTGSSTTDIDFHGHNATGGTAVTLVSTAPGSNEYRIKIFFTGEDRDSGGSYLTTGDVEEVTNLAAGAHTHWDFTLESGTTTDGVEKTGIITLTGRAP